MQTLTAVRRFLGVAAALGAVLAAGAVSAQAPLPPLPDGYMRAPPVPTGMAPKMHVAESTGPAHVFAANFSTGDEIVSGLTDLAIAHGITAGYVTGLGGLSTALLAWGDPELGAFKRIPIEDKAELVSLVGDIQMRDGKPYVHLHGVVAFKDGSTKAGHIMEAHVSPVAEISVVATSMGAAPH
jgi:uncharacterized protein